MTRAITAITATAQRLPWPRAWLALCVVLVASSGDDRPSTLDQIRERGQLIMLTTNGATTYYLGPEGETGFEYELGSAFADFLGVPLEVVTFASTETMLEALANGQGDLIAAGLPSPADHPQLQSGPVYETVSPMVVYRQGSPKPDSLDEMGSGTLALLTGKGHAQRVRERIEPGSSLEVIEKPDASVEDLFDGVSRQVYDYTIADSNIVELNRRFFPAIGVAFELEPQLELAWAIQRANSNALADALAVFFTDIENNDQLAQIKSRHYQVQTDYEPVGTFTFMAQVEDRLPKLKPLFDDAANEVNLDWALLAAVGYQESHWDPNAVSPTGVRGVMMLTQPTAAQLGVSNRLDPAQSILGGARYLRSLLDRLPSRIEMPDRLYLALAAYNIGLGHLEDARVITQRQGKNPDRWVDVREYLPLLTQRQWYSETRYGYARGYEAVAYVANVRTFYEILLWMDQREHPLLTQASVLEPETATRTRPD